MTTLKLKIAYNGFEMELDGEENSVKELYEAAREDIIYNLVNRNNENVVTNDEVLDDSTDEQAYEENIDSASRTEEKKYPSLFDVVKKSLPNKESEWVLVYCLYASNFGESFFTRTDLIELYEQSKRATESRKANLSNNLQSLIKSSYVSQVNEQDMTITDTGKKQSEEIVFGLRQINSKGKKEQNVNKESATSSSKSTKRETYSIINLELSEEQRTKFREIYRSVAPKSQVEQIILLCYLLKDIKNISNYSPDIIHTALKVVDEKTPKVLSQALRNIKNRNQYLERSQDGTYFLNHIGEDFVKFSLLQGANE